VQPVFDVPVAADDGRELGQAGYWVPRSVAFEHRIAAAVADPGVVDVSTTMTKQIPHFLARMIDAGEAEKFDQDMELALKFSAPTRATMAFRMRPYGTTSPYEFFTAVRAYALTDEVIGQISCPVLVTRPATSAQGYSATYVPLVGTVSARPCSRSQAIARRTVDRPSSNSSMKSASLGRREPRGYSPDSIRSATIAAS
jgi:hypothetical protein